MASTESKYKKSSGTADPNSFQLVYPIDLATSDSYIPHVVVFEPNALVGSKVQQKTTFSTPANTISGSYGTEAAMYGKNSTSLRAKQGFTDFAKGKTNQNYKKTGESIVLPMPAQLVQNYITTWQSTEFGSLARMLDLINTSKDHQTKQLASQVGTALGQTAAGAAQSLTGVNIKDYLELTSGQSVNNYAEILFKGVANRTLPFLFTFAPRNQQEAMVVQRIIHRFKFHMYPEYKYEGGNNSYLLHPSTFDMSFIDLSKGGSNSFIGKMSTCALTSLSVNGTPNGEYSALRGGGFPVCQLELAFTELVTLSKEDMVDPMDSA